jgi:anaerobic magnesium-protoporphyrin IX monomethyl ester cyclase
MVTLRPIPARGRAHARVLLVGYEDQDNLGLRYITSRLRVDGHDVRFVGFRDGAAPILAAANDLDPHVIGFSLIFQYLAPEYGKVMDELRGAGLRCHFTVGGHCASFEDDVMLQRLLALDSVVRFEGPAATRGASPG